MKTNPDTLRLIIENQETEIKELKDKIYGLMVDNEYMKLRLGDLQSPEEMRSTLRLLNSEKVEKMWEDAQ